MSRCVVKKRSITSACVVITVAVRPQRVGTSSRVKTATCIVMERLVTDGRVVRAVREAEQRVVAFSGIATGIAAIRWRGNRVHS